jgi:nucleoside-diphosphate-sugar epimerase
MTTETILVTGGSGFLGSHLILQLLAAGYRVRTTVRSLSREAPLQETLARAGAEAGDRLEVVAADLGSDAGWAEAVAGCRFVHHVASPFPPAQPRDERELIRPAVDGTLRVLRAARDAGVERVVLTSSFAAIGYGNRPRLAHADPANIPDDPWYTEEDWTDAEAPGVQPYMKSKTLAERAAWDFIAREGGTLELVAINPAAIFGPVLNDDLSTSTIVIKAMLEGRMPGVPDLAFGVVDVRDVADLHLRAMRSPSAAGERYLAVARRDAMTLHEMAAVLRKRLGARARRVPRRRLPDWLVRLLAVVNPMAREAAPRLGLRPRASNDKACRLLGWNPRPPEDAVSATAESLLALGLIGR